jgi:MoaA/NifB/PqqE/SkfB family radical SAM enzyme
MGIISPEKVLKKIKKLVFPKKSKPNLWAQEFTQIEMSLPVHLLVATTFKCSARCPHCMLLQQNRKAFHDYPFMEDDLFARLMASPFTKNVYTIGLGGGEALLHPKVFEWANQAKQRGIPRVTLFSNGLSLQDDKNVNSLLKQDNIDQFNISLDSTTAEGFCRARGIKQCDFEKICDAASRIANRFRATNTLISGSFVTYGLHAEEMLKILTFCEPIGLHKVKFYTFHQAASTGHEPAESRESDEIKAGLDQITKRKDYKFDISIQLPLAFARKAYYCPSLSNHLCVGETGYLAPCCHMPWDEKYGHFDEADTNPINHPRITALRNQFILAAAQKDPSLLPEPCHFCNKRTLDTVSFVADRRKWRKKIRLEL